MKRANLYIYTGILTQLACVASFVVSFVIIGSIFRKSNLQIHAADFLSMIFVYLSCIFLLDHVNRFVIKKGLLIKQDIYFTKTLDLFGVTKNKIYSINKKIVNIFKQKMFLYSYIGYYFISFVIVLLYNIYINTFSLLINGIVCYGATFSTIFFFINKKRVKKKNQIKHFCSQVESMVNICSSEILRHRYREYGEHGGILKLLFTLLSICYLGFILSFIYSDYYLHLDALIGILLLSISVIGLFLGSCTPFMINACGRCIQNNRFIRNILDRNITFEIKQLETLSGEGISVMENEEFVIKDLVFRLVENNCCIVTGGNFDIRKIFCDIFHGKVKLRSGSICINNYPIDNILFKNVAFLSNKISLVYGISYIENVKLFNDNVNEKLLTRVIQFLNLQKHFNIEVKELFKKQIDHKISRKILKFIELSILLLTQNKLIIIEEDFWNDFSDKDINMVASLLRSYKEHKKGIVLILLDKKYLIDNLHDIATHFIDFDLGRDYFYEKIKF